MALWIEMFTQKVRASSHIPGDAGQQHYTHTTVSTVWASGSVEFIITSSPAQNKQDLYVCKSLGAFTTSNKQQALSKPLTRKVWCGYWGMRPSSLHLQETAATSQEITGTRRWN